MRRVSLIATIIAISVAAPEWAPQAGQAGPRFRPDGWNADEYGRQEGYPVGPIRKGEKSRLIGSYTRGDHLLPMRELPAASAASPLTRAAKEPRITYRQNGATVSLDGYLDQHPTIGLLIARGNQILVERYQYDRRDTDRFTSQSMAKSLLGLLVGVAVREGRIRSIADTAETYVAALQGSEYGRTPIKALLQMSSGIEIKYGHSDENGPTEDTAARGRAQRENVAAAVLGFNKRAVPPGTRFNYTSSDTMVLGLVLAAATGKPVADYAREKIWEPLGAEAGATWRISKSGEEMTSCCFAATLRDWTRLGLMLAHEGKWNGRQIVPPDWLRAATTIAPGDGHLRPKTLHGFGYGYQIWLLPDERQMFALRGLRGQTVVVDPRSKTVMVHAAVLPIPSQAPIYTLWRGVLKSLP